MAKRPAICGQMKTKPEILAPAGAMPQMQAAVHAGADAVYFGLDSGFNARVRANSFAKDELNDVMTFLHDHGCKGYLTLNILVFDEELSQIEDFIRHAAHCGVDALIVQDIGVIKLARKTAPQLPIHGSTQMSITDANGVNFASDLGIQRIVLGRELSIEEMHKISTESTIEIEAFVHGALCVSYSGQCFSSEAWGGRSANRGQCAQACRLPYSLLVDGQIKQQGDFNYLLSPQDLMALQQIPRLIEAGISCFKIEGRLKGPEYVLSTVRAYREALDKAWQDHLDGKPATFLMPIEKSTRRKLAQVFSRGQDLDSDGLTAGFLEGPHHQSLVIGRSPRHRGLYLGLVKQLTREGVTIDLQGPVKAGDGVVFDSGNPQRHEPGGNVFHLNYQGKPQQGEHDSGVMELTFGRNFQREIINIGDRVWRTKDASMDAGTKLDRHNAASGIAIKITVVANLGQPVSLYFSDHLGHQVQSQTVKITQAASKSPLDAPSLRKAIGQLGDTPFEIDRLNITINGDLFIPMGEIKQARRQGIELLKQAIRQHKRDTQMPEKAVLESLLPSVSKPKLCDQPLITLLCRTREQVEAAINIPELDEIIVDFLEVHGLKDACERVRNSGKRLIVAAPRIFKPGEQRLVRYYCHLNPDALLVRSTGLLWHLNQLGGTGAAFDDESTIPELWGDFSLNASNLISAQQLLDMGLARLAPTHDLNGEQICALATGLKQRASLEVIAHHHLPIFHTEYCVFARFLSSGNSYKDCGRPCEKNNVHVRDPSGAEHLVLADIGCRNTVFNAQAQSAAPFSKSFQSAGINHYRLELVDEPAEQVEIIVRGYLKLLAHEIGHQQLWETLSHVPDANNHAQGVGLGSLGVRVEQKKSVMKTPTAR